MASGVFALSQSQPAHSRWKAFGQTRTVEGRTQESVSVGQSVQIHTRNTHEGAWVSMTTHGIRSCPKLTFGAAPSPCGGPGTLLDGALPADTPAAPIIWNSGSKPVSQATDGMLYCSSFLYTVLYCSPDRSTIDTILETPRALHAELLGPQATAGAR